MTKRKEVVLSPEEADSLYRAMVDAEDRLDERGTRNLRWFINLISKRSYAKDEK